MDGTEVRVDSRCHEGVGKALARLPDGRFLELILSTRDYMRRVIVVGPGDCCVAGSVKMFGEKLKLSIATSVLIALTGADALVSESLPCVLLKSATATNIANARVPVFKCFRSG